MKKIRQEPEIPALFISEFQKEKQHIRDWLGAKIKNIETLAERSASGLSEESGVIILEIEENSLASKAELQKGDVIIRCENQKVATIDDLLHIHQGNNWMGRLNLVVFRNQKQTNITIPTKQ